MSISKTHKQNFDTLLLAACHHDLALVECQDNQTKQNVYVVCAVNSHNNGDFSFVPLAVFFNGNPYELLNPPNPDGGFYEQGG